MEPAKSCKRWDRIHLGELNGVVAQSHKISASVKTKDGRKMIQLRKLALSIAVTVISLSICGRKGYAQQYCVPDEIWMYTANLQNTTACIANELAITFPSTAPATICLAGVTMLAPPGLPGAAFSVANLTSTENVITTTFSDPVASPPTIPLDDWTYIGAQIILDPNSQSSVSNSQVTDISWMFDGVPCGAQPKPATPSYNHAPIGSYFVVKTNLYTDLTGKQLIGTQW